MLGTIVTLTRPQSNPRQKVVILRQNGISTSYGDVDEVRPIYIDAEREIDEGYVQRRNHIVFVARYSENDDLLEAYCRLGSL